MTARKTNAANTGDTLTPPDKLGFEEAMAELDNLIQAVENNRLPLEQTLQTYQRGQQLITRCGELLKNAEQRIQQFDGAQLTQLSPTERA